MSPLHPPFSTRRPSLRAGRFVVATAACAVACALTLGTTTAQAADGSSPSATPSSTPAASAPSAKRIPSDVVMVQANIKTGMSVNRFQSDVRTVLAPRPDFVTYNEVPRRQDGVLAPAGYAIWRTPGEYTGAIPVVWREDTWSAIDQGTRRISNYRKIAPKRHTMLGLRYANWVTLKSVDGRTVSVVSVHVPPLVNGMPDLRRKTVKHIGSLVEELSARGPVLVGGDFNVHYKSSAYPRDVLTADGMVPTYDALGSYFPTGDHQGATIDYVFATPEDQIQVVSQRAVELNSDHDAVVAGLNWTVDAPADTTRVSNVPTGSAVQKRLVLKQVLRSMRAATAGESLDLVTSDLTLKKVEKAAEDAAARGVFVRVITLSAVLTGSEQQLAKAIGTTTGTGPGLRQCVDTCAAAWGSADGPVTMLLHRADTDAPTLRVDVNGPLDRTAVVEQSKATLMTGRIGLANGESLLSSVDSTATQ